MDTLYLVSNMCMNTSCSDMNIVIKMDSIDLWEIQIKTNESKMKIDETKVYLHMDSYFLFILLFFQKSWITYLRHQVLFI